MTTHTATQTPRRTEPYISLSKIESQRLFVIEAELTKIYLQLRWQANFKTGVIGATPERPVSIQQLETYLGLSPDHVSDVLGRLQKYGLVDYFSQTQTGQLTFRLPLSIAQTATSPSAVAAGQNLKLPAKREHESLLLKPKQYFSNDSKNPSATLSHQSTGSKEQAEPRESSNDDFFDQLTDIYHAGQVQTQECENPIGSFPDPNEIDQKPDWDNDESTESLPVSLEKKSGPSSQPNAECPAIDPLDAIKTLLSRLGFQHVEGSMSRGIYPRLLQTYSVDEIKQQAERLALDRTVMPTPLALATAMAKRGKNRGMKQGGVVL